MSMAHPTIEALNREHEKKQIDPFEIGDTVDVHVRIVEGEKERIQVFSGTVIARGGKGVNESFTVRRVVQGEGVERIFPVHGPRIEKVETKRRGRARRAKLYFLRDRVGKAIRLKEENRTKRLRTLKVEKAETKKSGKGKKKKTKS